MGVSVPNCLSLWRAAKFANERRYFFAVTVSWPITALLSTGPNTGECTSKCARWSRRSDYVGWRKAQCGAVCKSADGIFSTTATRYSTSV